MFEIGLISIIVLAVGYWVTLWLMGRHDDVLHGDFVHAEEGVDAPALLDRRLADRPPFPPKPVIKQSPVREPPVEEPPVQVPSISKPAIKRPAIPPAVAAARRASATPATATPARAGKPPASPPATASAPTPSRADRTDTLQALLASIKRDLKDASQL